MLGMPTQCLAVAKADLYLIGGRLCQISDPLYVTIDFIGNGTLLLSRRCNLMAPVRQFFDIYCNILK